MKQPHLLVCITAHGYGHVAVTAPVVNRLRERLPGLRVTLQTAVPGAFLASRFDGEFAVVAPRGDLGPPMRSALAVDVAAMAAAYGELHRDFAGLVAGEAERLAALAPDLVLSSISYVAIAAAERAGIPAFGLSPLNWAEIYRHFCGSRPEAPDILAEMEGAYGQARRILKPVPSMPMTTLANGQGIGVVARRGRDRRAAVRQAVGASAAARLGVVVFGGIDQELDLRRWPRLDGWHWLVAADPPPRPDMTALTRTGMPVYDLLRSCDLVVTKPGYGTFTEAAVNGAAVLYVKRRDWPESPYIEAWLAQHARSLAIDAADLSSPHLGDQLRALFSQPPYGLVEPTGIEDAADALMATVAAADLLLRP